MNESVSSNAKLESLLHFLSTTCPEEIIRLSYLSILNRDADAHGLASYSSFLKEQKDPKQIFHSLIGSAEFSDYYNTQIQPQNLLNKIQSVFNQVEDWSDFTFSISQEKIDKLAVYKNLISNNYRKLPLREPKLVLYFVADQKKEYDSVYPVYQSFIQQHGTNTDIEIHLLDTSSTIENYLGLNPSTPVLFLVSIELSHRILKKVINTGVFVYLEHGAAPIKTYTYSDHYTRYDYSLLPGQLWCDRLSTLYPEHFLDKNRLYPVGYPKLDFHKPTKQKRIDYCKNMGLDPLKPIIIFAPTWSNSNNNGIFNLRYVKDLDNVIAIPHDGDFSHAQDMINNKTDGYKKIHLLDNKTSISYHYNFADILISDISSTIIEFLRIGKKAISIKSDQLSDFDFNFFDYHDNTPQIPHTAHKWNFCPVVEPNNIHKVIKSTDINTDHNLINLICDSYGSNAEIKCINVIKDIIEKEYCFNIEEQPND